MRTTIFYYLMLQTVVQSSSVSSNKSAIQTTQIIGKVRQKENFNGTDLMPPHPPEIVFDDPPQNFEVKQSKKYKNGTIQRKVENAMGCYFISLDISNKFSVYRKNDPERYLLHKKEPNRWAVISLDADGQNEIIINNRAGHGKPNDWRLAGSGDAARIELEGNSDTCIHQGEGEEEVTTEQVEKGVQESEFGLTNYILILVLVILIITIVVIICKRQRSQMTEKDDTTAASPGSSLRPDGQPKRRDDLVYVDGKEEYYSLFEDQQA